MKFENKIKVAILQHPQEPGENRNSLRFLEENLQNFKLRIGLSVRNLDSLNDPAGESSRWGVLYLGSFRAPMNAKKPSLYPLNKKGLTEEKPLPPLAGILLLDGTWSQAKTLWWRNAWLLKLKRLALVPERPSLYGKFRKEPRKECLSTAEAALTALKLLGEDSKEIEKLESKMGSFFDALKSR